jgi:DNA-directed RNA polymerase subunit delta
VNLKQYSPEELKELSMIEAVHSLLEEKQQATIFHDLVQEIAQLLGLSEEQVAARIAQFYTDLNIDGRFINLGENRWGLRGWYPYEQIDEEILPQPKPKKKRKVEEDEQDEILDEDDDDLEDLEDDDDFADDDELEYDESGEEEEEKEEQ